MKTFTLRRRKRRRNWKPRQWLSKGVTLKIQCLLTIKMIRSTVPLYFHLLRILYRILVISQGKSKMQFASQLQINQIFYKSWKLNLCARIEKNLSIKLLLIGALPVKSQDRRARKGYRLTKVMISSEFDQWMEEYLNKRSVQREQLNGEECLNEDKKNKN